jgi:hypothetical protein
MAGAERNPATFVESEVAVGVSATSISPERAPDGAGTAAGRSGAVLAAGAGTAGLEGELRATFAGVDVVDARTTPEVAFRAAKTVISILPLLFRRTKS